MRTHITTHAFKIFCRLSFLILLCLHCPGIPAQETSVPDLVAHIKPAVVYIMTTIRGKKEIGQGSGFLVRSDQIISNWHVVEDAQEILVRTAQGDMLKVKSIIATDRVHDLALLQLEGPVGGISPLDIASSSPREGEYVVVVGNPKGLGWSNSDGRVSSIRELRSGLRLLQITAPVSPGSSGSPVVNTRGQVVGVVVGAKEGGENLNFAIPSEYIAKLYSDSSDRASLLPTQRTSAAPTNKSVLEDADGEISPAALKMSRSFYYQGSALQSNNDCKGALPLFEKAVVVNPKFADAWFSFAYCQAELGRPIASIENYKKVIQLRPDMYDAHWNLALLYFDSKQYRDAAASYRQAASLHPDSVGGHLNLGLSYFYSSQIPQAIASFRQVIRLKPDSAPAYYMLGRSFQQLGQYQDAVEAFRRADLFKPGQAWTIYSWGVALTDQKSYGEAIDKLKEATNLKSDFSEAYTAIGDAYYRNKVYDAAISQYKKAIELKGDDIEPYQGLSNVYIRLGRKEDSVSLFRDLVGKKADNPDALMMLGAALIQTGDEIEAQKYIQQSYRLNPNDPNSRLIVGYNYTETGNYAKAAFEYTEAIRLAPENRAIYSIRGWNYLYSRQGNPAASDAVKFLSLNGWRAEQSLYMVLVGHFGYRLEHREQEARKLLTESKSRCDTSAWPYAVVSYLQGELTESALIALATDNDKKTEAHGYIGMNFSLLGHFREALQHFSWVKDNGNRDFTEHSLAISESKYIGTLSSPPELPTRNVPARRVRRP